MKKFTVILSVALLVSLALIQVVPVAAFTTVSSYSASCSSFSANGTTNAPYVVFWVEAYLDGIYVYHSAVFPNSSGSYSHSFSFPAYPTGTEVVYYTWGAPISDAESWDNEAYFEVALNCVEASGNNAPPIPAGFVLSTILCDVAVHNTPAGAPVRGANIIAGQTWFTNPTPVTGDDGASWTEIFAGGFTNGYIPTACVG